MLRRYKLLVIANIAFCCAGAATKRFPAWRMFESMDTMEYRLSDKDGATLSVYDYLPRDAYLYRFRQLPAVLTFICRRERARAPLRFTERVRNIEISLGPDDCEVHAKFP